MDLTLALLLLLAKSNHSNAHSRNRLLFETTLFDQSNLLLCRCCNIIGTRAKSFHARVSASTSPALSRGTTPALTEPTSQEMRAWFQHGHSQRKYVLQIELVQLVPLVFRLKKRWLDLLPVVGGSLLPLWPHNVIPTYTDRLQQRNPRIHSAH